MRANTNIAALLVLLPGIALAQFKCTGADGKVSFQQMPCQGQAKAQRLELRDQQPTASTADTTGDDSPRPAKPRKAADVVVAEKMARDRRVRELERQVADAEGGFDIRNQRMAVEMDQLHSQRYRANNYLAGATYEQSLATEMHAVAAKYKALNDVEIERLKTLREELARAKAAAAA